MDEIQLKWDRRWLEKAATSNWQEDSWLRRVLPLLSRGQILDVACGIGRNALYLAEQGFEVTAVDISPVALELLENAAKLRNVKLNTCQLDLEAGAELPAGPFDLVINFFYLQRPLLPKLRECISPGGFFVFRTFSLAGADKFGSGPPEIALREGELLEFFADWKILLHEEGLEPSSKGGSLAGIVAQKPQ